MARRTACSWLLGCALVCGTLTVAGCGTANAGDQPAGRTTTHRSQSDAPPGLTGVRWNLISARAPGKAPVDTTRAGAHVTFTDHTMSGNDGVNHFSCSTTSTSTRIVVGDDCTMTAAGLAPGAPTYRLVAVKGIGTLLVQPGAAHAEVQDSTLTITAEDWVLRFRPAT